MHQIVENNSLLNVLDAIDKTNKLPENIGIVGGANNLIVGSNL